MKKKKKSNLSRLLWVAYLCFGFILGTAAQEVPQFRAITHEITQPSEHHINEESLIPGHPVSSFHINRQGYCLAYDAARRNPLWVYEHLTTESLKGSAGRDNCDFKEDENLPKHMRAQLADYRGSCFDRGHMAPAANHKSNPEAMDDTFYISNMCPQCPKLNRGYWASLEKHVRDLTKDYKNVYVISGPLYLPNVEEGGKRYIKIQVLGQNDVAVPSHFFKVISLEDWQGKIETRAYILPNGEISQKIKLDSFKTTVERVERASGIIFNKGN